MAEPAIGPAPSYSIGGPDMVLVKNWHFGSSGTIRNMADMSAHFYFHDQFGTINNGGKYGSNTVSPDIANAIGGQPIEGVNSAPVRAFTKDSLQTFLTPLDGVTKVQVRNHNAGNGSFMAKWRLPRGGSLLGRDIVWETRVRYVTPPYYWFAIWTAGNKWKWDGQAQGAEHDLVEGFGYDNGGGNTNYDGRYWHSNTVASPSKDTVDYSGWGTAMEKLGIKSFDPTQYHTWTWHYKKDNSFTMYVDGIRIQGGVDYHWTFGNKAGDEPIDMDFLFDAGWGHNQIGSVNKELDASAFKGKFYEWNYSRVYLSGGVGTARPAPHKLPGTIKAADFNAGTPGVAYDQATKGAHWRNYTVQVLAGGRYTFSFQVASPRGDSAFHIEDQSGANLTGALKVPRSGANKPVTVKAAIPATLSSGAHVLKLVRDSGSPNIISIAASRAAGTSVTFVKTDTATQGSWKSAYGAEGFVIAGDATKPPAYGTVTRTGWQAMWNGNGQTGDARAPQKAEGGEQDRIAGQWGTNEPSYDIECKFTDGQAHQVALYGLDWDKNGRSQDIQVLDAESKAVLDTQDLNAYVNGKYLVWNIQGHVIFRVTNTSRWTNPALSAIFFDPIPAARPSRSRWSAGRTRPLAQCPKLPARAMPTTPMTIQKALSKV